jgi:hypothetical protein
MSDSDLDRLAYELVEGDTDRAHGEAILDAVAAKGQQDNAEDPILEILRQAHQAKASEAGADKE